MKFLIVLLVCVSLAVGQFDASQQLKDALNNLKDQMPCGFPSYNIPPLSPYKGDEVKMETKFGIIKLTGGFRNYIIDGLNEMEIKNASVDLLKLHVIVHLNFRKIRVRGDFDMSTFIVSFWKMGGKGDVDVTFTDMAIIVDMNIGMVNSTLRVTEMQPKLTLKDTKSKINGLMGFKPLANAFNKIIDHCVLLCAKYNHKAVSNAIREVVVPQMNEAMKGMTIADILAMMKNPSTTEVCIPPAA